MDTNTTLKEIDEIEIKIKKACVVINIAHDYIQKLKEEKRKLMEKLPCSEV